MAQSAEPAAVTNLTGGSIGLTSGAGATTNGTPGNIQLTLPANTGTGAAPGIVVTAGVKNVARLSSEIGFTPDNAGELWLGNGPVSAPSGLNYSLYNDGSLLQVNAVTLLQLDVSNGKIFQANNVNMQFFGTIVAGGGQQVIGVASALTNPTSNPSSGNTIIYSDHNSPFSMKNRGPLGGITTFAAGGSAGTVNSQTQVEDQQFGTAETISSNTPTAILSYATASASGGLITAVIVSRSTTSGTGIAVGDTATATYVLAYKNASGTVALSTAGITLVGSVQTTAAALTSTLTASVATNVITLNVTNTNLCTVDSQVLATIEQN